MTHYPREIACEIEIDKNFNLDRAIYTLSKFLSIETETAILVAGWLYIQSFYLVTTFLRQRRRRSSTNSSTGILPSVAG
jgi:hypothetical protein